MSERMYRLLSHSSPLSREYLGGLPGLDPDSPTPVEVEDDEDTDEAPISATENKPGEPNL